jgi:hypothetical protein
MGIEVLFRDNRWGWHPPLDVMNATNKQYHHENQPTEEMIHAMITEAIRAPTGDNCQPWKFHWNGKRLWILHSETIAAHRLNRKNHASMMALGALIEAFRLSATRYGFETKTELLFEENQSLSVWAEIRFVDLQLQMDPLAAQISLRTTDRRLYQGGVLSPELIQKINTLQQKYPACQVHIQAKQSSEFKKYFLETEKALWTDAEILQDLGRWLRLSKKEVAKSTDGIAWKELGLNSIEALMFRFMRRFPTLPRLLWSFGFGQHLQQEAIKAVESSAALICFSVNTVDPQSLCQVGELAYQTWLLLGANGFGVQPMSFASTSVGDAAAHALDEKTTDSNRNLFATGKLVLQRNFSMSASQTPIWMFRTGVPPQQAAPAKSLRHSLKDLLMPSSFENKVDAEDFGLASSKKRRAA